VFDEIRRSGSDVVKRSVPPVLLCGDLRLRGVSARRKSGERAGNARGAGAVKVVRVADVGWTHRVSFPPDGRETGRWVKKGTSWTEARSSSDEGHGRVEGETVCGCAVLNSLAHSTCRPCVCKLLNTTEGALGSPVVRLLPAGRYEILRLLGQTLRRHHPERERGDGRADRAVRIPTRACPGVTKRASEVDTVR
jgi:hypothetical protein